MAGASPFSMVVLRFHYGGLFSGNAASQKYLGGMVREIRCDPDMLSYMDLLEFCKEEGFHNIDRVWWLHPRETLGSGLRLVWNDESIIEMSQCAVKYGVVDIYMEHGVDVPELEVIGKVCDSGVIPPAMDAEDSLDEVDIEDEIGEELGSEPVLVSTVDEGSGGSDLEKSNIGGSEYEKSDMGEEDWGDDNNKEFDWQSDNFDSDDEDFVYKSEDENGYEEVSRVRRDFPIYRPKCKSLEIGMMFRNSKEFKSAVTEESFRSHRPIIWVRNTWHRVRGKCGNKGCPWHIFGSVSKTLKCFQLKTYTNEHKCNQTFKNPRLSATVLASMYGEKIRKFPDISVNEIKEWVKEDLLLNVSASLVSRAKKIVNDKVVSNFKEEFGRLWDYAAAIREANPNSCVKLQVQRRMPSDPPMFKRYFVMFDALKKGFLAGCRHVLGLDGCFLKSLTKGELISAVGIDANNNIYPLAWAVVEVECTESWRWFLGLLRDELQMGEGRGWTLITDQQKGLINAVDEYLPSAEHRNCARHIYANWSKKHKGHELRMSFWRVVKAPNMREYEEGITALQNLSETAAEDLLKIPCRRFCLAFFQPVTSCDLVCNNISETFNSCILPTRGKAIISMLEEIRRYIMQRIVKKREESRKLNNSVGRRIRKILDENASDSMKLNVLWNGEDGYEIGGGGVFDRWVVNLRRKTCSCGRFGLSGLPCAHAICAIYNAGQNPVDYVAWWYTKDAYEKSYEFCLQPMPGRKDWPRCPEEPVCAPPFRRMPGRQKKRRRKDAHEPKKVGVQPTQSNKTKGQTGNVKQRVTRKGTQITCRLCHGEGHNSRGCGRKKTQGSVGRQNGDQPLENATNQDENIGNTKGMDISTQESVIDNCN